MTTCEMERRAAQRAELDELLLEMWALPPEEARRIMDEVLAFAAELERDLMRVAAVSMK